LGEESDPTDQWVRYYERAERRRKRGYEDPFARQTRLLQRRERFTAVILGLLQVVILAASYAVLTKSGH
jgi:hypothetical protein